MKLPIVLTLVAAMLLPVSALAAPSGSTIPRIDTISPTSAARGSIIEAHGVGFGGGTKVQVTVGSVAAVVLNVTGTSVRFRVPGAAPLGTVPVIIKNAGGRAASSPINIIFDGTVHPTLDAPRQVTETIGPAGGTVTTTTAGGVRLTLWIPTGAVATATQISLAPVSAITDLPLSGGLAAAAHFEPSGLALTVPARLTIEFTGPPPGLAGFVYAGPGNEFVIVPVSVEGSMATIEIEHFSGGGAGAPAEADFDALVTPIIASLGALTYGQITSLVNLVTTWEALFGPEFCESRASCGAALQKAATSLSSLADSACATGLANLTTDPALVAAAASLKLLLDYEAAWDELRRVDEALGSAVVAPQSVPVDTGGQTSAPDCREAILDRIVDRAIDLAEAAPFGTSEAAAPPGERPNVAWLFDLAAEAQLLGLDEASTNAIHAGETIVEGLISGSDGALGAIDGAVDDPFGLAPSTAQQPYVLANANFDGTGGIDNLEWLYLLSVQAATLGLDSAGAATGGLEAALEALVERSAELCLTDIAAGSSDLNRGRSFVVASGILGQLVAAFVAAIDACPVRIVISPTFVGAETGGEQQFTALVTGADDTSVTWSSPDAPDPVDGRFMVPMTPGTYHVTAASTAHPSRTATAVITATTAATVALDVTPDAPGGISTGDTIQFSAAVAGSDNTAVTWTATGGTVSSSGLFTATTGGLAAVTATSQADPEVAETVVFEVIAAPITVSVDPAEVWLQPGASFQLVATVAGTANTAVIWDAYGGTITPDGLFTAGTTNGIHFYVYAYSVEDPASYAYVMVRIAEPASVTLDDDDGQSRGHVNASAAARNSDGSSNAIGDCEGATHPVGTSMTQTCSASNDYGDRATATASQSSTFTPTVITISGSATADASSGGARLDVGWPGASASMGMLLAFTVAGRPVDYQLTVLTSAASSCLSPPSAGARLRDVFGNARRTTGTIYPGFEGAPAHYRIEAGTEPIQAGTNEANSSCQSTLTYTVTLALTPWADTPAA